MIRSISYFLFISCLLLLTPLYAGTQTLTTYYPAPQGDYVNMVINNNLTFKETLHCTQSGTDVALADVGGSLEVCDGSAGSPYILNSSNLWKANGTYIYPYTPTQRVEIGSATDPGATNALGVTGNVAISADTTISGNTTLGTNGNSNTLTMNGNTTISGDAVVGGTTNPQNYNLNIIGNVGVSGNSFFGVGAAQIAPNDEIMDVTGRIRSGNAINHGGLWVSNNFPVFVGEVASLAGGQDIGLFNNTWNLNVAQSGSVGIGISNSNHSGMLDIRGPGATPAIYICNTTTNQCGPMGISWDSTTNSWQSTYG